MIVAYEGILLLKSSNFGLNLINLGLGSFVGLFGKQWTILGLKGGNFGLKRANLGYKWVCLELKWALLWAQIGRLRA